MLSALHSNLHRDGTLMECAFQLDGEAMRCERCSKSYPLRPEHSRDPRQHHRKCSAEEPVDCIHRGLVVGSAPCGCGARGKTQPVYACTFHRVDCTEHALGKAGGKKYRVCATCPDYQRSLPQDAPGRVREGSAGG